MSIEAEARRRTLALNGAALQRSSEDARIAREKRTPHRPEWAIELSQSLKVRRFATTAILKQLESATREVYPREEIPVMQSRYISTEPAIDGWAVELVDYRDQRRNFGSFALSTSGDVWLGFVVGLSTYRYAEDKINLSTRFDLLSRSISPERAIGVIDSTRYSMYDLQADNERPRSVSPKHPSSTRTEAYRSIAVDALVHIDRCNDDPRGYIQLKDDSY